MSEIPIVLACSCPRVERAGPAGALTSIFPPRCKVSRSVAVVGMQRPLIATSMSPTHSPAIDATPLPSTSCTLKAAAPSERDLATASADHMLGLGPLGRSVLELGLCGGEGVRGGGVSLSQRACLRRGGVREGMAQALDGRKMGSRSVRHSLARTHLVPSPFTRGVGSMARRNGLQPQVQPQVRTCGAYLPAAPAPRAAPPALELHLPLSARVPACPRAARSQPRLPARSARAPLARSRAVAAVCCGAARPRALAPARAAHAQQPRAELPSSEAADHGGRATPQVRLQLRGRDLRDSAPAYAVSHPERGPARGADGARGTAPRGGYCAWS